MSLEDRTSKSGGQALLEWWEKVVPELTTITTMETGKPFFG
jgi:hypothetical protein